MNFNITQLKPFGILITPKQKQQSINSILHQNLFNLFHQHQLLVLRGFISFAEREAFSQYCQNWGEISVWPFGKVLELIEQDEPDDHIFDNSYVPLHWDGMYRPQVPEYQIFHCVKAPLENQGGRTTFTNTLKVLTNAPLKLRQLWRQVSGHYHRRMEFYHSKTVSPIITKHPYKNHEVIRYNEPPNAIQGNFVNPPKLKFTGIDQEQSSHFHTSLQQALYHPDNYYAHQWQNNDIVIADNFSLLHGREKFTSKAARHLQRVHVLSNPPYDNPGLEAYQ